MLLKGQEEILLTESFSKHFSHQMLNEKIAQITDEKLRLAAILQAMFAMSLAISIALCLISYLDNPRARRVFAYGDLPMLDLMSLLHMIIVITVVLVGRIFPRRMVQNQIKNNKGQIETGFFTALLIRNALFEGAGLWGVLVTYFGLQQEMHLQSFYILNLLTPLVMIFYFVFTLPARERLQKLYSGWFESS